MRIRVGQVALWLLATGVAIGVASAAIAQVGRQVALDVPIDEQLAQVAGPATGDARGDGAAGDGQMPEQAGTPVDADVRTYEVVGGSAAIVIADGAADVRWATPNDGFRASVERSPDGTELRVDFRSDDHRSRIKVEFEHGEWVDEIDEDDRR